MAAVSWPPRCRFAHARGSGTRGYLVNIELLLVADVDDTVYNTRGPACPDGIRGSTQEDRIVVQHLQAQDLGCVEELELAEAEQATQENMPELLHAHEHRKASDYEYERIACGLQSCFYSPAPFDRSPLYC